MTKEEKLFLTMMLFFQMRIILDSINESDTMIIPIIGFFMSYIMFLITGNKKDD